MNRTRTRCLKSRYTARVTLALAAGLAVGFSVSQRSDAIERVRVSLGISAWEDIGITGTGAVVADFTGLPPLVAAAGSGVRTHRLLAKSNPIALVFEGDNVPRQTFASLLYHDHQTATAGAMVANGGGSSQPKGIAPDAQLLVGWFGIERNSQGGYDSGPFATAPGGGQYDAMIWTLMAMTDQDVADVLAASDSYSIDEYTVATVVNASIGRESFTSRRGDDEDSRIFNVVASMTGATLVAPTSNDGLRQEDTGVTDPTLTDLGEVYSPGSANNVIAVGAIARDFSAVLRTSGQGPIQSVNYADSAGLYPTDNLNFVNPFTPAGGDELESDSGIFRSVRAGVDIVAPGDQLNLPGFVAGSGLDTTRTSRLWVGTSFSSAIVAGSVALMHELGEREGLTTHNLVTRAVLLNSANKSNDGVGVGFDNMQQEDASDDDRPEITTIGLDEEVGAGSLDLRRLLNQYFRGTVVTDYMPGDGVEGYSSSGNLAFPETDSYVYNVQALGTDPLNAFVTENEQFMCAAGFGGALLDDPNDDLFADPWERSNRELTVAQRYGPFNEAIENLLQGEFVPTRPMRRHEDPDLGGGNRGGDGADGGAGPGSRPVPPADGSETEGAAGGGTRPFRTGWDHGRIGEGYIDLPIGMITPGSGISITLTWNRQETIDLQPFEFATPRADYISFGAAGGGEGGGSVVDPRELFEFEFEDLNLELWRQSLGPGGDTRIAASEGVWNNTECIYFEYEGGPYDSASDGPFGNAPANYYIRIRFEQTLWDYGGFWFCTGGDNSIQMESLPQDNFVDLRRAEVEYGLAWYVDFNASGVEFLNIVDRETSAVNIGIPGLIDNIDRQFATPVGDINSDLIVDANDASLMIQNFGSTNPLYDLNNDGIADALDLETIALNVGRTAEERKLTKDEKKAERQRRKAYKKMVKERRKTQKKTSKRQSRLNR